MKLTRAPAAQTAEPVIEQGTDINVLSPGKSLPVGSRPAPIPSIGRPRPKDGVRRGMITRKTRPAAVEDLAARRPPADLHRRAGPPGKDRRRIEPDPVVAAARRKTRRRHGKSRRDRGGRLHPAERSCRRDHGAQVRRDLYLTESAEQCPRAGDRHRSRRRKDGFQSGRPVRPRRWTDAGSIRRS